MPASPTSLGLGIVIGATMGAGVAKAFRRAERSTAELGEAIGKARNKAHGLRKTQAWLGETIRRSGDATGELTAKHGRLDRAIGRTTRALRGYKTRLGEVQRLERARARWGDARGFGATALGGAYTAARAIGTAFKREEAAAHLRNVLVSDNVEEDLEAGLAHARNLVRLGASQHSEVELLEIQYALNSAGLEASAARVGSAVVSQVATLTKGAPEQVGEVVATTFNNLGDTLEGSVEERLARVGDILTKTQFAFSLRDFGQLGEGMASVANAASLARLDLDQTAAAIGLLNTAGKQGSEAGTAMSAVLRKLGPAAEQLGFAIVRDADDNLDLVATLEGIDDALAGLGADARSAAVLKAFGEEGSAVDSLLEKLPMLREKYDEIRASGGLVGVSFEDFVNSGSFARLQQLRNNFAILTSVIGESAPAGGLLDWANSLVVNLGEAVEGSEGLQNLIVGVGGALGGLALGYALVAGIALAWLKTMAVLKPIVTALGWVAKKTYLAAAAQWVYNKAVAAGSVGRALPTTRWGKFKAASRGAGRGVMRGTATGATKLGGALKWVGKLLLGVVGLVGIKFIALAALIGGAVYLVYKYWEPIKGFFGRLWDGIVNTFWTVVDGVKGIGGAIIRTLAEGLKAAAPILGSVIDRVFGSEVADQLPQSDARRGPLSHLTASGASILGAMGEGVRRAGPGGLAGPLTRELTAATAALAIAAPAAGVGAAPAATHVDNSRITITINQQPGEDAAALTDRIMAEIDRRQAQRQREALYDVEGL